jgi:hypothetical protein
MALRAREGVAVAARPARVKARWARDFDGAVATAGLGAIGIIAFEIQAWLLAVCEISDFEYLPL